MKLKLLGAVLAVAIALAMWQVIKIALVSAVAGGVIAAWIYFKLR